MHCIIADRGRGIFASLKAVRHELQTDSDALRTALLEQVSGRAPEKRGNGLKFAVDALHTVAEGSFRLQSGTAKFQSELPLDPSKITEYINLAETPVRGVYSEIQAKILYAS